jgi:hypothetical protein
MSKPLSMVKWATVFGVGVNKMRKWRNEKKYPFEQISDRRWALPLSHLPAEHLQKYKEQIEKKKS